MAITLDLALVREQCRVVDEISDALLQTYVDAALRLRIKHRCAGP